MAESPCWVIRDGDGDPWDDDRDVHYSTFEDAESEIADIRDEESDEEWSPEDEASLLASTVPEGQERDRAYALALASRRKQDARVASLHPVELPEACYQVGCEGDSPRCEETPESDEYSSLHFSGRYPFDPGAHDWHVVGGRDYCDGCYGDLVCGSCGEVMGDGADRDERLCAECVEAERAKPGPLDVPLLPGAVS